MEGMDPRRTNFTPGSSSGNGGRSLGNTSSRRRGRMSDPPSGTRLMPWFNAAATDGGGSGSSSTRRLDLLLDEWRLRNIGIRSLPDAPPPPHQVPYLFLGSPMLSPAVDDNVLIMDGVLVGNSGSRTRRSVSLGDPGFVAAGTPGCSGGSSYDPNCQVTGSSSSGGGRGWDSSAVPLHGLLDSGNGVRFGSNGQFAQGREEPLRMQAMRPRFSEVVSRNRGWSSAGFLNVRGSPITSYHFPPSRPSGPAFPTAAPRAVRAVTITAPASHIVPPRVTITAPRPSPSTPTKPETEPAPPPASTSFTWPPTEEEDAIITQRLYGPTTDARRRLPVFRSICPED